jgi:hypothetical protein
MLPRGWRGRGGPGWYGRQADEAGQQVGAAVEISLYGIPYGRCDEPGADGGGVGAREGLEILGNQAHLWRQYDLILYFSMIERRCIHASAHHGCDSN